MAVNTPAAYAMDSQDASLNDIVHTLNQAGFDNEDICMMLSPSHPIAAVVRNARLFGSERGPNGATAGLIGMAVRVRRRHDTHGRFLNPLTGFFSRSDGRARRSCSLWKLQISRRPRFLGRRRRSL
jgi:hypothetical protein